MTTPGFSESNGLTLEIYLPLVVGSGKIETASARVLTWNQTALADGGWWSASFNLAGDFNYVESWMQGMGRHMIAYNRTSQTIGEWFVNSISLNVGTRKVRLGPLMGAPNRVSMVYVPKLNAGGVILTGTRTRIAAINSTAQQVKWGIIERVLNGGEREAAVALQELNIFLGEHAEPVSSEPLSFGAPTAPSVTLECLGYIHWMSAYIYNNITPGTTNTKTFLGSLLTANPNTGMYSTDYSDIATNATTVERYTNDDKTAYALMKEAISKGDSSNNRWLFGMYKNRKAKFEAIPTTVQYEHHITENEPRIKSGGVNIDPWDVLPGRWVSDPDFLIGRSQAVTDPRDDPRNVFIESVTYSSPNQLAINGSRVHTLSLNQMAAQLGLSGLGGG